MQDSGTTDRIDFSLLGPLEVDLSDDATQSHWRVLSKPIGYDKITSETQSTPRGLVLVTASLLLNKQLGVPKKSQTIYWVVAVYLTRNFCFPDFPVDDSSHRGFS